MSKLQLANFSIFSPRLLKIIDSPNLPNAKHSLSPSPPNQKIATTPTKIEEKRASASKKDEKKRTIL